MTLKFLKPGEVGLFAGDRLSRMEDRWPLRQATVNGRFLTVPNDFVLGPALRRGGYESFELDLVKGFLRPGDNAADVGASCGLVTLDMAEVVGPQGRVLALEPAPASLLALERNLLALGLGNVEIYPFAAHASPGRLVRLHLETGNAGDHHLKGGTARGWSILVQTCSLDQVTAGRPLKLIKVDTQGSESFVLQGARETLKEVEALALEWWPWGLKRAGSSDRELADLVFRAGFKVSLIDENKKALKEVSKDQLLREVDPRTDHFRNLWCRRS